MTEHQDKDDGKNGGQPPLGKLRADLTVEQARAAHLRRELHRTELLASDALKKLAESTARTGALEAQVRQFDAERQAVRDRLEALEKARDDLHRKTASLTTESEALKAGLSSVTRAVPPPVAGMPSSASSTLKWRALLPEWMKWKGSEPRAAQSASLEVQRQTIERSGMFDPDWYRRRYPDIATGGLAPLEHYLKFGWREDRDPAPGFSTKFYVETNVDVKTSGLNPLYHYLVIGRLQSRPPSEDAKYIEGIDQVAVIADEFDDDFYRARAKLPLARDKAIEHYLRRGWKDGLDPHPQFSTRYYLAMNADVWRAGINPYVHYVLSGRREGRLPRVFPKLTNEYLDQWRALAREFDVAFYRSKYPDVVEKRFEPILHYLLEGWRLGYDPHPQFSTAHYLDSNPDVRQAGINPYVHFLAEGRREGRSSRPAGAWAPRATVRDIVAPQFDPAFYLARNLDIAAAGVDPLDHFLDFGWREGRDPRPGFSTTYYLDANSDVAAAGVNPFFHYLVSGKAEGREPTHPGGWRALALARLRPLDQQIEDAAKTAPDPGAAIDVESLVARLRDCRLDHVFMTFSHDDYTTSVGGIQLCLLLEEKLAREKGVTHIDLHPALPIAALSRDEVGTELTLVVTVNGERLGSIPASELQSALAELRSNIRRTTLVVHSLLGHSPETLAKVHTILEPQRAFLWLHDFFTVCPSYTLLRNGISYCRAPEKESTACTICSFGEERRDHLLRMRRLFEDIPFELIAPSAFAAEYWRSKSDLPAAKIHVQPHCTLEARGVRTPQTEGPVRVAFLGHPSPHKGWMAFLKVLDEFAGDPRFEFHHLGAGPQCDRRTAFSYVSVLKGGPNAAVDALIANGIDVVLLWSIWPETFSFVAHEAMCAGSNIITCTDAGNIARVATNAGGLVLENEAALLNAFRNGEVERLAFAKRSHARDTSVLVFSKLTFGILDGEAQ